jgi:hypothetical protein
MLFQSVETMKFDSVCGVVRPMSGILMYLTAATRNGGYETSNGCSSDPSNFVSIRIHALVCLALSLILIFFDNTQIYK